MNEAEGRKLLAVDAGASPSQLKSAYHRALKLWHPDLVASDSATYPAAVRQTKRINAAYRILLAQTERGALQQVTGSGRPAVGWNGWLIRTSLGRFELSLILACAVLIAASAVIHEWIVG